jgi:hypothetical protein
MLRCLEMTRAFVNVCRSAAIKARRFFNFNRRGRSGRSESTGIGQALCGSTSRWDTAACDAQPRALPVGNSASEFARFVKSEMNQWGKLAQKIGLRPDQ